MKENKTWKVYKLTSPNGRVYIGCTELPMWQRWQNGRGYRSNKELYDDILQYGWVNFEKVVIAEFEDEKLARQTEHLEITRYPDGYNIYCGSKGYVPTGNPKTPPKPVICKETQITYPSAYQASKETGLARNKILEVCNGKRRSWHKTHWSFV